ncbi:transporter [candidate division TA06 bacterium]|nr:transporter [candidate division TA06 bacterium]
MKLEKTLLLIWILLGWIGARNIEASAWTLEKGGFLSKLSLIGSRSSSRFNSNSEKDRLPFNGVSQTVITSLDLSYGLRNDLTLSASFPLISYDLKQDLNPISGIGFGDIRSSAKINFLNTPFTSSTEFVVKFPTAVSQDPSLIRIGEGQFDFEWVSSNGILWNSLPAYSNIEVGYRVRMEKKQDRFNPGNEFLYRFETGYSFLKDWTAVMTVDGFWGQDYVVFDIPLDLRRNLLTVTPSLVHNINPLFGMQLSLGVPVMGRSSYAGTQLALGLFYHNTQTSGQMGNASLPLIQGSSCCTVQ